MAATAFARDAIAIGYSEDGAWAAVTYNRSSTPKGGPHYHDATQAGTFALRDLHSRCDIYLAKTEILGKSDDTGYVAIARGKAITRSMDVTAVGRGTSQAEADRNAMRKLFDHEATTDVEIVYRYFSYGLNSGLHPKAGQKSNLKSAATKPSTQRKS